jgi:hypothetical protein
MAIQTFSTGFIMSKEAMEIALEALKDSQDYIMGRAMTVEAAETLEEALAKQEQGEPVAWRVRWTDGSVSYREEKPSDACSSECEVKALYVKE